MNFVAGGSLGGGGSSERAAALLDTHLVPGREGADLTIQAHRHLGEERRQRLTIRLVAAELLRFLREADQDVFDPAADVVPELLVLRVQLLPEIALTARHGIVELRDSLVELLAVSRSSRPRSLSAATRPSCSSRSRSLSDSTSVFM